MASIERDARGRYLVRGERVYGAYRSADMAVYRLRQVAASQRPPKKPRRK